MFWREFDAPSAIKQYGYAKREEKFSLTKICVIEQNTKFCITYIIKFQILEPLKFAQIQNEDNSDAKRLTVWKPIEITQIQNNA